MMRNPLLLLVTVLSLAACKQTPTLPGAVSGFAYKIDIQQGNAITQEMVAKLRAGMTPAQVRYILGSPLVTDPFHPERWDYVYTYAKEGKLTERRRLTVIFDDNKLVRLEGDVVPDDSSLQAGQTGQDGVTGGVPVVLTPLPAGVPIDSAPPVTGSTVPPATPQAPANAPTSENANTPTTTTPAATTATGAITTNVNPATPTPAADPAKTDAPKKPDEKGFFGKMMDKIGL